MNKREPASPMEKNGKCRAVIMLVVLCGLGYLAACVSAPSGKIRTFERKECVECHTDFVDKYFGMKNVHAVVKEKQCEACHLRHGKVPKLLFKRQGNELCLECHKKTAIGMAKAVVHTALKEGTCTDCHVPHASNTRSLLKAEGRDLCYQCTPK